MDTTRSLILFFAAAAASPALAQSLTVVNEPWAGEATHAEILANAFGGSFASLGTTEGVNYQSGNSNTLTELGFSNGTLTAMRVADSGSTGMTNLENILSGDDSTFSRGSYRAEVMGGYSSLSHEFGVVREDGSFRSMLATGNQFGRTFHPDEDFEWAMTASNGAMFSSESGDGNGNDHMVTYAVYDANNQFVAAVLFFEDWAGSGSDYDYNDLTVMLTLAPAPQAALLGLAGIGGIGLAASRRRR